VTVLVIFNLEILYYYVLFYNTEKKKKFTVLQKNKILRKKNEN